MAKQATRQSNAHLSPQVVQRVREGSLLVLYAMAAFLLLSLISYDAADPGWSNFVQPGSIMNAGGKIGAWLADFLLYMFGYLAYLLPIMFVYGAWYLFHEARERSNIDYYLLGLKAIGFVLVVGGGTGLANLYLNSVRYHIPFEAGGIVGNLVAQLLARQFNLMGATVFLLLAVMTGVTCYAGLSWPKIWRYLLKKTGESCWRALKLFHYRNFKTIYQFFIKYWPQPKPREKDILVDSKCTKPIKINRKKTKPMSVPSASPSETIHHEAIKAPAKRPKATQAGPSTHGLPALDLLDAPALNHAHLVNKEELEQRSQLVEQTLRDFGVNAQVVAVHPGPVITRYELELAPGLKASRLSGLARDIARSLSMVSVRVVEIIPGKSVVGLELPNDTRVMVTLREILESKVYQGSPSPLTLGLGKDIAGTPVAVDLAKMPHLLVAGTTGSGKSVGVNAMLMSILYKATPEEVRLILVDPKMLELSIYDGIQHLLTPVVTDMKEAANALRWCVAEMERRYQLMAALGVRNIGGCNSKISKGQQTGQVVVDPLANDPNLAQPLEKLPYIVVIIDEFADMMMVVGKKVEQLIARIAQKARAAGIHLILATQRPSVDVITGLIKANIPTRMAFQVSSKIDSRTIIDQQGAEQLLGHGDMLYLAPGSGVPTRVHGAFVADHEVHQLVDSLKTMGEPDYLNEIIDGSSEPSVPIPGFETQDESSSESDPLYDQCVEFITTSRRVSISGLQRRFKIGFNRAARIIEDMEVAGIVSGAESGGSREVLAPAPIGD